jgi:hypothetical protein
MNKNRYMFLGFTLLTLVLITLKIIYFKNLSIGKNRSFSINWPKKVDVTKLTSTDSISTAYYCSEEYNCRVDFILIKTHIDNGGSIPPFEIIESAMSAVRKHIIDEPIYNKNKCFNASVYFSTHNKETGVYGIYFFSYVDEFLYIYSVTSPLPDALKSSEVVGVLESIDYR